jgi:HSP20 family protein
MTKGTAVAPATTRHNVAQTDPLRLFRTRLFDEPLTLFRAFAPFPEEDLSLKTWAPPCDIFETEREVVVKAELPEVKKEDVRVAVENNTLTISGERRFEEEVRRENYTRVERNYGEFMRSFSLPTTVDPNRIHAEFTNGMLTVTLPKREEARPKQIEVKVA